jgi:hypothetical protein
MGETNSNDSSFLLSVAYSDFEPVFLEIWMDGRRVAIRNSGAWAGMGRAMLLSVKRVDQYGPGGP